MGGHDVDVELLLYATADLCHWTADLCRGADGQLWSTMLVMLCHKGCWHSESRSLIAAAVPTPGLTTAKLLAWMGLNLLLDVSLVATWLWIGESVCRILPCHLAATLIHSTRILEDSSHAFDVYTGWKWEQSLYSEKSHCRRKDDKICSPSSIFPRR